MIDFPRLVAQQTGWSSVSRRTRRATPERIAVPFGVYRSLSVKLLGIMHLDRIDGDTTDWWIEPTRLPRGRLGYLALAPK